ncbi:MAG TPA: excinuclease ABC subunit UvrA [Steroidobacteraceae bacterium]|nr:excinuclease ABC subunit UvrA [Steroidobacteraceae bacterium]
MQLSKSGTVQVRGARTHNLRNVDLDLPRDALVVFTGVSGSGKSSLAFGTIYAEAQRRYFESVSPYARRLIDQVATPDVDTIEGLPPAVALQQHASSGSSRSSVGSITTVSNLLRMLYSRAGDYPPGQGILYAEDFSPNTPQGACSQCHGLGRVYDVSETTMVPDPSLSIAERAIAAWPPAWHGQNLQDILVTLGHDIHTPRRKLPKKSREWILYTDEQPTVPVYAGFTAAEVRQVMRRKMAPSYMGTFTGVRRYLLQTFQTSKSPMMRKRAARFLRSTLCSLCKGKRLRQAALRISFAGLDIAALSHLSFNDLSQLLQTAAAARGRSAEKQLVATRIVANITERIATLQHLGLGYLAPERATPTLSPGELQRLRLATQLRSNLFGVIYVLDEPSAGLHPADTAALMDALDQLRASGNSLFIIEHDLDVMGRADWLVEVGPGAGSGGGRIVYNGPPEGLRGQRDSATRPYLFAQRQPRRRLSRIPLGWLRLKSVTRNNLRKLDVAFPLGVFTVVTGVSGSGKSSLVSLALTELLADRLAGARAATHEELPEAPPPEELELTRGEVLEGEDSIRRIVAIDQRPIGRTPRSNLATYTGLFDEVRKIFAKTQLARSRRYAAGHFSFNVDGGRCPACHGEGFVSVELLFMPSVFAPCSTCRGSRYTEATLEVTYRDHNIAEILAMTVDQASLFFNDNRAIHRPLQLLQAIGLGYLTLGQPATELSGGEAQRVKLATELQRVSDGATLYLIDEPTVGLHPSDIDKLMAQLDILVEARNTVILAEHDMHVAATADWIIDLGPGAGDEGGRVVVAGTPETVASHPTSRTSPYLAALLAPA